MSEKSTCQNERSESDNIEEYYFGAYASIDLHHLMIADVTRTHTYKQAILKNFDLFRGKVVADIGCGTGILSIFCAQAGAKTVYAVDASDIVHTAEKVVKSNGYKDKIRIMKGKIEDIVLPEKVDVIVSEWMGYMLFYEFMLPSVLEARDRYLKPGGYMFPSYATLYMAPLCDYEMFSETVDFWGTIKERFDVDMSYLSVVAQQQLTGGVHIQPVYPENIQAHAIKVCDLDLSSVTAQQVTNIQNDFTFYCFGHTHIHGFVFWFDVRFPRNIVLSTSPYKVQQDTHWHQTVLYIDPMQVEQDTKITGSIRIAPNSRVKRTMDIVLIYAFDDGETVSKQYTMDDTILPTKARKTVSPSS